MQSQPDIRPSAAARELYEELREFLPWACVTLLPSGAVEEVNSAAARLLGCARAEIVGTRLQDSIAGEHLAVYLDALAQSRLAGTADGDIAVLTRSGRKRPMKLHVRWFEGDGRPRHRVSLVDVSQAHKAHAALQTAADQMRDLYENAPCGYHSLDARGTVIQMNDTELRWLGYRREEVVGRIRLAEILAGASADRFERAFRRLKERGQVRDVELEIRRKNGSVFPALLSATAVRDAEGQFLESRASLFDVTRRRMAEAEARGYAQQLKAIARRAGEIQENERRRLAQELHDRVGQNLTALTLNLNIVKGQVDAAESAGIVARLDDSLKLLDSTVESIRGVMSELRPAVLDDYGLAAAVHWYAEEFGRRSGIATTVAEREAIPRLAPLVEGVLFRIAQEALTNVVKHAGASKVQITLGMQGAMLRLSIADDGRGFDEARLRPPTRHGGWGLMIMRERAESAAGHLRVESGPRIGTCIVVEVPTR
ncbi:MAG TPA: PAS domain-containing protein [Usitatibacter sp.]|nr:PAS domain-containing protein [Usitatibacter sp.]